jgi:cytochrome c
MRSTRSRAVLLAATLLASGWIASCAQADTLPPAELPNGNPVRGAELIQAYGCGTCHSIPGIRRADGLVGPPLEQMGRRSYIAGSLVNNGPNMQLWLVDPQLVEPGTAMPDLSVTPDDARDIAAYLFTLD